MRFTIISCTCFAFIHLESLPPNSRYSCREQLAIGRAWRFDACRLAGYFLPVRAPSARPSRSEAQVRVHERRLRQFEREACAVGIVWSLANETHTARQHGCIHVHAAATFESQPIHGAGKRDHPRAPSIRAPGERYPSESFLIAINHPSILVRPEHASTCVCGRVGVRVRVCRREQDVVYSCVEPFSCCAPRKWE